jgi:GT2 family glycosyltransferase
MEVVVANFQHIHPKIDFLELQLESISSKSLFHVYLFPGEEISSGELSECKSQIEAVTSSTVKIFSGSEYSNSVPSHVKNIGVILESDVIFKDSFFENLVLVFEKTDTFALYSDFIQISEEFQTQRKLPAWSPIRFQAVDYLGPVLVFDLGIFYASNIDSEVSRKGVIDFAKSNELRISRVPSMSYAGKSDFKRKQTTVRNLSAPESVSIVIPTQGLASAENSLLENCVAGIVKQVGITSTELIVVVDEGYDQEVISNVKGFLPKNFTFKLVEFNEPFNFSRKCNLGASEATGEVILFLNDDVELVSADCVARLSSWSLLAGVGAIGSQLQFADGSIQHAGITLQDVKPRNSFLDQFPRVTDFGDLEVAHEVSGVTGACLAISRDKFDICGDWNEELPNSYNDVDLCLRLNAMGMQSVVLNDLKIVHNESSSRNSEFDAEAFRVLKDLWPNELGSESYLRSAHANGDYQGPWGSKKNERIDHSGNYVAYGIHLIREHGLAVTFKQLLSRISGSTRRMNDLPRHEYL